MTEPGPEQTFPWCVNDGYAPTFRCRELGHRILEGPQERRPGPMEAAVFSDLESVGEIVGPGRLTLRAMAIKLARVLDARGDEEPASQTAKAIDTLRITMAQLTAKETNDPQQIKDALGALSTPGDGGPAVPAPLRYPPKPRPADAGR